MQNKAGDQQSAKRGWLHRYWQALLIIAMVMVAVVGWNLKSDIGNTSASTSVAATAATLFNTSQAADGTTVQAADGSGAALTPEQRAQQIIELKKILEVAKQTHASYLAGTQYPQGSRPIAEHPDQVYPNRPIEIDNPLHKNNGQVDPAIKIRTTQSRVFIANKESVVFSVTAVDNNGNSLPLFITRAIARAIPAPGIREAAPVTLAFTDDGKQGDAAAGDGIVTASLTPNATSFANFNGTIRAEVNFNVGDSGGFVLFDIIYVPETPATWAGQIRDVAEAGSLSFYLKANVNQAGRYLVSARVDDANGKPFALLSFNDLLPTGTQDIKLPLFGKLIVDQRPAFPLTLRDVDAYLLKENTDPDRALMPRLVGPVHVSKKYDLASFSSAEATSEERSRYLTELTKDVNEAQAALDAANGKP
jgi:hypothetical protein